MSDIRRCPFCGGNAKVHKRRADSTYYVYVACGRCKSRGKPIKTNPLTALRGDYSEWYETAIEAWNKRFDEK